MGLGDYDVVVSSLRNVYCANMALIEADGRVEWVGMGELSSRSLLQGVIQRNDLYDDIAYIIK